MSKKEKAPRRPQAPARDWLSAAIVAGIVYLVIGRVFAWPQTHIIAWRYAAWAASFVVFVAQIWNEHARLQANTREMALHVSVGVGIGGLLLAVAAIVYRLINGAETNSTTWLLAVVLWPLIVGVPAFMATWLIGRFLLAPKS